MRRHRIVALTAMLWWGAAALAQPVEDPVNSRVTGVMERFVARLRGCDIAPAFVPAVAVESGSGLIGYDFERRTMIVSRWSELAPPIQSLVGAWARQGTMELDAPGQFGEIFNDLLVAHEMGHWLAHLSGSWRFGTNMWDSEVEANRIAVAFWLAEGDEASAARRIANFNTFLEGLPSPVPAGADPAAHFNANYEALSADPGAYGWYQGAFMRTAWAERGQQDFCALARRNVTPAAS